MNRNFFGGLGGRTVTREDAEYNAARKDWNRACEQYPLAINYCRTREDAARAVLWARRKKISLRIRNGGHNYAGYSNGDNTLVIDMSEMTDIAIDEVSGIVVVGGGVTNGLLYEYLAARGYPFPGGTCPTVGVAGYALGGGWGLSCRLFGLGCDSIKEITLVDWRGRTVKASPVLNPDLFWACRGAGGGNFGPVVSITFALQPKAENISLIEINYRDVRPETQQAFLNAWQNLCENADNRLTMIARIYNSEHEGLGLVTRGFFYGTAQQAELEVASLSDIAGAVTDVRYMSFLQAVTIIGAGYPEHEKFASASRFVYDRFSESRISEIVALVADRPKGSVYSGISLYALGGRVSEAPRESTAFFHRGARYIMWLNTMWEDNRFTAPGCAWVRERLAHLIPLTEGAYVNFPYSGFCRYKSEYYGFYSAYLRAVKQKYDPCNVFAFPQGLACGKEI